jgi:amylosucrase
LGAGRPGRRPFGYDGIPLLYMGDELGLPNDHGYLDDPARAADNRWLHRPAMDWDLAGRRAEPGTVAQRIFSALVALAAARRRTPHLHAATPVEVVDLQQPQLFAFMRRHPLGTLVAVHNVTEQPQRVTPWPSTWSATTGRWTASAAGRPGSTMARSSSTPTRPSG